MLFELLKNAPIDPYLCAGAASFLLTFLGMVLFRDRLPKDHGREFAVNGALSKGKARGAGLILIIALIVSSILFIPLSAEYVIYLAALFLEMLSGYLDDASEKPWSEVKKGLIDLAVAIAVSVTVYLYHGSTVEMPLFGLTFTIPAVLYIVLGVVLIWMSINVTNCTDGVDGLCTSLSIVTLGAALVLLHLVKETADPMSLLVWMTVFMLLAYLWKNCSPSSMLMGDAGSRPLGVLLAMAFMISGKPFLFVPCALVLILDGGLGLFKLTVLRVTKTKDFMKSIRTPLHDHARKNKSWSDAQVVMRFTLLQLALCALVIAQAAGKVL